MGAFPARFRRRGAGVVFLIFDQKMPAIHALTAAEVLARLGVSGVTGLTDEEARARLKRYGPNTIVSRRKVSAVRVLLHRYQARMVSGRATFATSARILRPRR